MPTIEMNLADRRVTASRHLNRSAMNKHSQAGEDGIIERAFDIIEAKNKWCVEFGAWDGIHFSNTCRLLNEFGWTCVQIEGSEEKFKQLETNFKDNERSIRLHKIIGYTAGTDTIDDALATTNIPKNFDLISIDIDGNDYYIWESISVHRPRIVVIEFNPSVPNDVIFIQDRDMSLNEGCSLAALIRLARRKGYELICVTRFNAFFVVEEEFYKFDISDNSIDAMHLTSAGRIFSTYSGKIYHTVENFGWALRRTPTTPDMLQILPVAKMGWGDRLKPAAKV